MSVYPKGRIWHFDFVYKGRRYYGSTGQNTLRAAEAVERKERLTAALGVVVDDGDLTIDEAASKYLDDKDPHGTTDLKRRLLIAVDCVGKHKLLREIDAATVSSALGKRRAMGNLKRHQSKKRELAPATINRDIIDHTLRPLLNRARQVWGAKSLPAIAWKAVRLAEPEGIVREYSSKEVAAWQKEIGYGADGRLVLLALDLMLTYGLRFGELLVMPNAVDGEAMRLTIKVRKDRKGEDKNGRKAGDSLTLPLRAEHARALAAIASTRKPDETVFPFTYWGLHSRLSTAAKRAGLGSRPIHGARHHAATILLRNTGNLKLTQRLLGHKAIQSTARYAHANESDLRSALDGLSPNSPEVPVATTYEPPKTKAR